MHDWRYRGAPRRSLGDKLRMALGVAQGMQALEAAEPPILHRDLKPSNVFINAVGRPCVADMGLARRLTPARCAAGEDWTATWLLSCMCSVGFIHGPCSEGSTRCQLGFCIHDFCWLLFDESLPATVRGL